MALQKTSIPVSFVKGLNTKTDNKQLSVDNFLILENSVFDIQGQLTKRNGFGKITEIGNANQTTLTTLNDNLLATGSNLYAFSKDTNQWLDQGTVQPVALKTLSVIRSATSQVSPDIAVYSTGLACTVFMDTGLSYYQVFDSETSQQIVSRQALPATAVNPRVFLLNKYFIITFVATVSGSPHLQYIAIPVLNPTSPTAATDLSTSVSGLQAGYDAIVANNNLYYAWATATTTIGVAYLTSQLVVSSAVAIAASTATLMSVTSDMTQSTPVIWVTFYDSVSTNGFTAAFNQFLTPILAKTAIITGEDVRELTSVVASQMVLTVLYEFYNEYSYAAIRTDIVRKKTVTQAGAVSASSNILRSVGLASKPFINSEDNLPYVFVTYGEANQPTYFLINLSGTIIAKLAYANGGGYEASQVLPSVPYSEAEQRYILPYLLKDFLASTNKTTNAPTGTPTNSIYTQTGINIAKFAINTSGQNSSEIADVLNLTGGQMWMYDSVKPVEMGFHVWPENVVGSTSAAGGNIGAGTYYYQFTYEWTDNKGNLHRSAPSIPVKLVTTGSTSTNTLNVPTLRLTAKVSPNPVRIVGYRWSVAQQQYYQFTSLTSPTLNLANFDSVVITDTNSDAQILGQTLLYTTGGVIENIAPPGAIDTALFKNRLFLIDIENPNLLWFSKQVIQNTPVEMSDLLTVYVAPTTGAQGSTGNVTALSAMDDKLIIFKKDAIYYLTGQGPDNTGANNDFTDPTFITANVGCDNPKSIVLTPNGLMFQSDKGIWLLDRSLQTQYIGSNVEAFNSLPVTSAQAIPGTNQVRFVLNNKITLMYDYFYQQWGTFTNLQAISSTLYQGLQTYLNVFGEIYQETPGAYLDGSKPVLMKFQTAWINVAGVQGFERWYFLFLLGTYITPFKLNLNLGYDYNASASQNIIVTPDNQSAYYGDESPYGSGSPYGGPGNIFEARVFPQQQKCQSFQITVNELYDSTQGQPAGAGLTLSNLNMIIGAKKGYRTQKASTSFG